MTLTRRVFLAGEEAEWLADKIVATSEYGNDAARLLRMMSDLQVEQESLKQERDELAGENAAIRELMNAYNLGGWTDSLSLMKERDEAAAQVEVMRKYAKHQNDYKGMCEHLKHSEYECTCGYEDAMRITPSTALREIEARVLEDGARFVANKSLDTYGLILGEHEESAGWLTEMAAAKLKGE